MQALEKIGAADDGDTVTVRLPAGDTVLDAEVFEALAGRDVTLVLEMDGNVLVWMSHSIVTDEGRM